MYIVRKSLFITYWWYVLTLRYKEKLQNYYGDIYLQIFTRISILILILDIPYTVFGSKIIFSLLNISFVWSLLHTLSSTTFSIMVMAKRWWNINRTVTPYPILEHKTSNPLRRNKLCMTLSQCLLCKNICILQNVPYWYKSTNVPYLSLTGTNVNVPAYESIR